jgi:uncharacterized membrane protein (UPF0182 family)
VQLDAPEQVDAAVLADPVIATQVNLLNRGGSTVRYGNLLVLPVGNSILYVKPLYVEATRAGTASVIPELKQVILAAKREESMRVVMRPTLRDALSALVGGEVAEAPPTEPAPGAPPGVPTPPTGPGATGVAGLAAEAQTAFEAAEAAQRSGDWAEYGRQMNRVRSAIERLNRAAGGQ